MITWRPIAELPDELKDGRDVLLWEDGSAALANWVDYSPGDVGGKSANWHDERGSLGHATVTHFAEINGP